MKKVTIYINSLAHTSRNYKYHIVFLPKYRRKLFFAEKQLEIRDLLAAIVPMKKCGNSKGRGVYQPHIYVSEYPA